MDIGSMTVKVRCDVDEDSFAAARASIASLRRDRIAFAKDCLKLAIYSAALAIELVTLWWIL